MAILLTGTTIGGHSAVHAGNLATHGIITTSNIGSYALTSVPSNVITTSGGAINGYVRINQDWTGGDYGAEQFTIRGTYASIALRNTIADFKWLLHTDSSGNFRWYTGSGVDSNTWTNRFTFGTDNNFYVDYGHVYVSGGNSVNWNTAYGWGNHASAGYLAASSYTAADILTKIKTVDGAGSGLDADYIDGLTSSQFLRRDTSTVQAYSAGTGEMFKWQNNSSGGTIQLGFQQNDTDGLHHRAYLKAYKSAAGSVAGKFDIVIRSVGGGTTADIFELEAGAKARWQGNNLATEGYTDGAIDTVNQRIDNEVLPAIPTNNNQLTNGAGYITDGNTGWNNTYGFITASDSITGTSAGVVKTVSGTSSAELVRGNMGDNDQARILVGASASNAGYLEIATADDGTEPIFVRQYTGVFSTLQRTATLLDASGNTSFPGTVTASTFSGALSGNASTATKLATARNIALSGAVTGNANFDGSGNITIATTATSDPTLTLAGDASGSATFTNLGNATLTVTVANDSHTHDGRYYTESESDARFVNVTGDTITGNLLISGASLGITSTAQGTEAFYVDGVNGRLFTISDDLSDSLFSVNTIAGLPVIEAFADNTVKIGPFTNPVTINNAGTIYARAYRGNDNVAGTGEATYHPAGIYSTGTNWLYGTIYMNVNAIYDLGYLSIVGSNATPINITGASSKYLTINPGNGYEAMVRYVGGSGSSWYVGKRTSSQLVDTASFHFYSEAAGATVGGITTGGVMYVTDKFQTSRADGTMFSHGSMSDAMGWNGNYGTYIGSSIGGTYYLYANGTFYDAGTIRTLIHTGNIGSQSVSYATTAGALTSMNISQFSNNSGYIIEGGISFSGEYPMMVRTSANTAYSHVGIKFRGSDSALIVVGTVTASGGNSTNWNTAYGWGNHASAGYLTSLPSHNHDDRYYTESEIDSQISNRLYQARANGVDVNAFNATGLYRGSTSGWTNRPSVIHNGGALLTIDTHPGEYHSQFFFDTGGDRLYFRNANAGSWGSWRTMWHSGNLTNLNQLTNGPGYITSSALSGYATQTYVNNAVSALVDSAPGTLDTLNELAAALGDDPNFATTVTNSIATKLPLTGGTMQGNLNFGNFNITNVNAISIGDPGPGEGIAWGGGNGWAIYESPNDLVTNTAGNLQFVKGSTRIMTLDTSNNVYFAGTITASGYNKSNWDTAYSWGNHAAAGYQSASTAITTSNIGSQSVSYASSAGSANQIDGWNFSNTGSNSAVNADTIDSNGITYYTGGVTNFSGNASDGALYSQRYSSSWQHQIAGDYRSGMIAVRGKNNGTWTAWKTIIDSSTIGSQSVNYANSAGSANAVAWANVSGKPSTFTPSAHTHAIADVTGLQTALDGKQAAGSYLTTSGKAADSNLLDGLDLHTGRNNEANKVVRTDVNGYIQAGWINTTSGATTSTIDRIYASNDGYVRYVTPATFRSQITDGVYAPVSHTHTIANVTGLQSALDGKQAAGSYAAASHTHAISEVTGLQTALDSKQPAGSYAASNHNHTYNVNDPWLRDNGDNATVKLYGNSRQMVFRTDGATEYASGVGGYPFTWMYGGDAAGNRRMLLATDGRLWTSYSGWLDTAFAAASHTHTPSEVGLGNVSNAAQVTTTNNSSLNTDSRNTRGVTRLYRRDSNSDYSVQTHWTGTYWRLMGYVGDSYHADTHVGYADLANDGNFLKRYSLLTSQDWNGWYFSGKMLVSSVSGHSGANRPADTYTYGSLLSYGASGEDFFQMYFPENGGNSIANSRKLHYRSGWNGGWSDWKTVVDMVGDTCTLFYGTSAKLKIQGSTGYGSPSDASMELIGDADNNQTRGYRFKSTGSDWSGQDLRIERYSNTFGYQLVGRIPKNTYNLEWQGTIVQGLSDARVKTNVVNMTEGLDKINQIRPVTFDWVPTEDVTDRDDADFGFIAQELEDVLPEAVHTRGDGYKTVSYEKVVPVLVQAMKEQQAMIEKLMARIETLENK